jgi:hypothetical protein
MYLPLCASPCSSALAASSSLTQVKSTRASGDVSPVPHLKISSLLLAKYPRVYRRVKRSQWLLCENPAEAVSKLGQEQSPRCCSQRYKFVAPFPPSASLLPFTTHKPQPWGCFAGNSLNLLSVRLAVRYLRVLSSTPQKGNYRSYSQQPSCFPPSIRSAVPSWPRGLVPWFLPPFPPRVRSLRPAHLIASTHPLLPSAAQTTNTIHEPLPYPTTVLSLKSRLVFQLSPPSSSTFNTFGS